MTDFFTSLTMAGAKSSSVGSRSASGVTTTPGRCAMAGATRSLSSLRSVIRSIGLAEAAGLLGQALRVQGVVERVQRIDHRTRRRHQVGAGRLRVEP